MIASDGKEHRAIPVFRSILRQIKDEFVSRRLIDQITQIDELILLPAASPFRVRIVEPGIVYAHRKIYPVSISAVYPVIDDQTGKVECRDTGAVDMMARARR